MYSRPYSLYTYPRRRRPSITIELWRLIIDLLLFLLVTLVVYFDVPSLLPTVKRGFYCADATLQFPYTQQTTQQQAQEHKQLRMQLALLALALPLAIIVIGELLRSAVNNVKVPVLRMRIPRFMVQIYSVGGAYLFTLALQQLAVGLTQNLSGRLRPYFRAACQPRLPNGSLACSNSNNATFVELRFIEEFSCLNATAAHVLPVLRHSFPSHTAAVAWYSMTFVALYMQARFVGAAWRTLRLLLQCCGLLLAALMSQQCLCRNEHHVSDVIAGAVMGVAFAAFGAFLVAELFVGMRAKRSSSSGAGAGASAVYGKALYGRSAANHYYSVCGVLPQPRRRNYYN